MSKSKTIVKNTLFLYIRMILTLGVGLITSRIVLNALGVEDFGIYSLVGGIVSFFTFMNSAMSSATQRYLSIDIGKDDIDQIQKTFNATLNIHFFIAFLVLLLAETVGLWFLNNKLNIPETRMYAANWVYQFSIFSAVFGIIQVPYNALLIAKEHMKVYAYVSIVESLLKLTAVFILLIYGDDKLIFYAFLLFLVSLIVRMIYKYYCKTKFPESKYNFYFEKSYYRELFSFTGWSLFGNIAHVARGQGSNILLNVFFGAVLNAAYGIAMQIQFLIKVFVQNFQVAINPQIIKSYAKGDVEESLNLILKSAKISFFLMFIIGFPIIINIDYILKLWLKTVPEYTSEFAVLVLVNILIETLSNPLMMGAQATGKIKWYQITLGSLIFLCLPLSYVFLKYFKEPLVVFWVMIVINLVSLIIRLLFLRHLMGLKIMFFIKNLFIRILAFLIVVIFIYFILSKNLSLNPFQYFIYSTISITIISLFTMYFLGLSKGEKLFILKLLKIKN